MSKFDSIFAHSSAFAKYCQDSFSIEELSQSVDIGAAGFDERKDGLAPRDFDTDKGRPLLAKGFPLPVRVGINIDSPYSEAGRD